MVQMTGRLEQGLVQIYTGEGKGKTTAALGQAFRAVGHDLKVFMIMFMKGDLKYGELESARRLAPLFEIRPMGRKTFVSKEHPDPIDIKLAQDGLKLAGQIIAAGLHDMVILDEINVALDFALIEVADVLDLVRSKPTNMELILTGRSAHQDLIAVADVVTEMKLVKHAYQRGIMGRLGIEY
jgi:cob(I)alamin adenosyltransferase